jgi:hypothetical protein
MTELKEINSIYALYETGLIQCSMAYTVYPTSHCPKCKFFLHTFGLLVNSLWTCTTSFHESCRQTAVNMKYLINGTYEIYSDDYDLKESNIWPDSEVKFNPVTF